MHLSCCLEGDSKDVEAARALMARPAASGLPKTRFVLFLFLVKHRPIIVGGSPLPGPGQLD